MFERDWARATAKDKFSTFMARENKGNKASKPDKLALEVGGAAAGAVVIGGAAAWLQPPAATACRAAC